MARLAAAGAASEVCETLFPSERTSFRALMARSVTNPSVAERAALDRGRATARRILESRADDGSTTSVPYIPQDGPGQWRRTGTSRRPPELPHWGNVRPFVIARIDAFCPPPPPALPGGSYARDVNEVRLIGGKANASRTDEQTLIAKFWSDFSYTPGPPGHWNEIAGTVARDRLTFEQSLSLFAVLNAALADAGIAAWHCKYRFNGWRPVTAIRRAAEDGNPATEPDPGWESLLPSPPHPEYVSGHAAFSGAAATVLAHFLGSDRVRFSVTSDSAPGVARNYSSFSECAREIASSRVFGGIHFSFSGDEGLKLGRSIAEAVIRAKRGGR
jgi:hypothetical protein